MPSRSRPRSPAERPGRRAGGLLAAAALCAAVASPALAQEPAAAIGPSLEPFRGGPLYLARDARAQTLLLVTDEGILLIDALGRDMAQWLHDELAARFPDLPVRHVVHSHHRFDRAEGSAVFTTATRIGHGRFPREIAERRRSFAPALRPLDRNRNGVLDSAELASAPDSDALAARDRDGDGRVTPGELYQIVASLDRTYEVSFSTTTQDVTGDRVASISAPAPDQTVTADLHLWSMLPTFFSAATVTGTHLPGTVWRLTEVNASFTGHCTNSEVTITASIGAMRWDARFGAPRGEPLRVGTYEGATSTAIPTSGEPGISVGGPNYGCNGQSGRFVVREADYAPSGEIRQFWATFEQRCQNRDALLRGNVRATALPPPSPRSCTTP